MYPVLTPGPYVRPHLVEDVVEPPVPELLYIAATLRALETLEGWTLDRLGARPEDVLGQRDRSAGTATASEVVGSSLVGASSRPCAGATPTPNAT